MKTVVLKICAAIVAVPCLLFATVFAIGSITGDHSLRYDNDGTWVCWTPRDRMSRDCWLLAPLVPTSYLKDLPESQSLIEWTGEFPLCGDAGGSLRIIGRADPSLMLDCKDARH
jgi:hypothetical protein